ncbi:hypothetical protein [Neisseria bacilliformis]|nr:hypothetical protein [Neisseria bacilliformis]
MAQPRMRFAPLKGRLKTQLRQRQKNKICFSDGLFSRPYRI